MRAMNRAALESQIRASVATKEKLLAGCLDDIEALCRLCAECLAAGGKLMFCGNGGSSCDASHAAGELIGWFENKDRDGLPAIALGHEVPTLTAIANDAGYEHVFARQAKALGQKGDVLIGISTSGGSRNVVRAMEVARANGIRTASLISERGGPMAELSDVAVRVPSSSTARIQECHLLIVHMLCAWLEQG